jgi:hypothetical protein
MGYRLAYIDGIYVAEQFDGVRNDLADTVFYAVMILILLVTYISVFCFFQCNVGHSSEIQFCVVSFKYRIVCRIFYTVFTLRYVLAIIR